MKSDEQLSDVAYDVVLAGILELSPLPFREGIVLSSLAANGVVNDLWSFWNRVVFGSNQDSFVFDRCSKIETFLHLFGSQIAWQEVELLACLSTLACAVERKAGRLVNESSACGVPEDVFLLVFQ